MFRIRRVADDTSPEDRAAIAQVQQILRDQFAAVAEKQVRALPAWLRDPLAARFRTLLFVAESRGDVKGFALLLHAPDLHFCYLDFISAARGGVGGGIGGALYQRVRDQALALDAIGIFLEALPDDPALCRDPATLRQNAARLRFYERYDARPITGTAYETPVTPGDDCPPFLVFDDLGRGVPLSRSRARQIVRAILERKYPELCPPEYVAAVLASFRDDPVRLRAPRYLPAEQGGMHRPPPGRRVALVVTQQHALHHVRERGYVEAPVRIDTILRELRKLQLFDEIPAQHFGDEHVLAIHDREFYDYLKRVCGTLPEGKAVYPYVFPIRNATRPPRDLAMRAGYYCIDTFTPLSREAFVAARHAVDCTLTAAQKLLEAYPLAYALVRPPGHHAERRAFGGFCYFGNAAIAAHYLARSGRVAVLDVDYHHGNSQQDIFWQRADVFTVSIHGHPSFAYPYFTGFSEERGSGEGEGWNLNLPLAERVDGQEHRRAVRKALEEIRRFEPDFLVVALGLDTARGDPTGSWTLNPPDFRRLGELLGAAGYPTLVVQEGGYRTRTIGSNARHFFQGLWHGKYGQAAGPAEGGQRELS